MDSERTICEGKSYYCNRFSAGTVTGQNHQVVDITKKLGILAENPCHHHEQGETTRPPSTPPLPPIPSAFPILGSFPRQRPCVCFPLPRPPHPKSSRGCTPTNDKARVDSCPPGGQTRWSNSSDSGASCASARRTRPKGAARGCVRNGADSSTGPAAPKVRMGERQKRIADRGRGAGRGRASLLIALCDRSDPWLSCRLPSPGKDLKVSVERDRDAREGCMPYENLGREQEKNNSTKVRSERGGKGMSRRVTETIRGTFIRLCSNMFHSTSCISLLCT